MTTKRQKADDILYYIFKNEPHRYVLQRDVLCDLYEYTPKAKSDAEKRKNNSSQASLSRTLKRLHKKGLIAIGDVVDYRTDEDGKRINVRRRLRLTKSCGIRIKNAMTNLINYIFHGGMSYGSP
jgi:hypothetical protein